jgi:hypothetical protein
MGLERELASLAEEGGWGGPVVSVYVDARWKDEAQRQRVRLFWEDARKRALADGITGAALEPIDRRLEALLHDGTGERSLAIFSGPAKFRAVALPDGTPLHAAWGERPSLVPLARAASESERSICAVVGAKSSRIYELQGEHITSRLAVERGDFPGRHRSEGFSPHHMERHVREHMRWELDAVAEALVAAFDRAPCRVFVCSTPQVGAAFLEILPQRVQAQVVALEYPGGDPGREPQEVVARLGAWLARDRLDDTIRLEDRVYQEAMGSGQGALGAQEVVLALQEGRVHVLLLKEGFSVYGAECQRCGALDVKRVTGCSYCGGPVRMGSLVESIVARALREGAQVRVMPDSPRHVGVGGIAALMRPRRGTGSPSLGYASPEYDTAVGKPG